MLYFERMIDSLKEPCFVCKKSSHLVITSCGCQTLCRDCANKKSPCST